MPKKQKPTKLLTLERLKRVKDMGRELKLKLKVVHKDMERMLHHIEFGPEGPKRRRRRRRS